MELQTRPLQGLRNVRPQAQGSVTMHLVLGQGARPESRKENPKEAGVQEIPRIELRPDSRGRKEEDGAEADRGFRPHSVQETMVPGEQGGALPHREIVPTAESVIPVSRSDSGMKEPVHAVPIHSRKTEMMRRMTGIRRMEEERHGVLNPHELLFPRTGGAHV